jgi:hypothetical protein
MGKSEGDFTCQLKHSNCLLIKKTLHTTQLQQGEISYGMGSIDSSVCWMRGLMESHLKVKNQSNGIGWVMMEVIDVPYFMEENP